MIRPACLVLVGLALPPCAQAQDRPPAAPMFQAYENCARQSFTIQRRATTDASSAAETAMAACATEEEAIFAVAGLPPAAERQGRIALRSKVKALLLQMAR